MTKQSWPTLSKIITLFIISIILIQFTFATPSDEPIIIKRIPEHLKDIMIQVTDDNAEQLETGSWFIDLYAPWCGYCQQVFPTIIQFAEKMKLDPTSFGNTKIAIIDGTTNPSLNERFISTGYPSLSNYKDGIRSFYRGARTVDGFYEYFKIMDRPPVSILHDRGHLKRAQGKLGHWENLFIYLGPNDLKYEQFQKCGLLHQSNARFYSPYGFTDKQSMVLSHSFWHRQLPQPWDTHWEHLPPQSKASFDDLLAHFQLTLDDLPIVINQPVGRPVQMYTGNWNVASHEGLCPWVEALLHNPIEQLTPYNFNPITENSDVFLLMVIGGQTYDKLAQLAILPSIVEKNAAWFHHFVWTYASLVPRLKEHYEIKENDFILIVNRDLNLYYYTTHISKEEDVLEWIYNIRMGDIDGKPLYHWANFMTPLVRDIGKFGERFTKDHMLFFLALGSGCLLTGVFLGIIYITFCMDNVEEKIQQIKLEQEQLQKLIQENGSNDKNRNKNGSTNINENSTQPIQRKNK